MKNETSNLTKENVQEEFRNAFSKIVSDIKDGIDRTTVSETPHFKKNDQGKLQWTLMPYEQLEEVVRVLMKGAEKYGAGNWKNCDDINRYKDALMRHVVSYNKGERNDPEDSLPHLAHAICNCLFLMYFNSIEDENIQRYLQMNGLIESEEVCQKK